MRISDWSSDVCSSDLIAAYVFDRAHPLPEAALAGTTHLLVSIAPDGEGEGAGDPALDRYAADIAALPGLAWIGYLSTTGVYGDWRSEEHTSELQSLMRISYAVFCLKKKTHNNDTKSDHHT